MYLVLFLIFVKADRFKNIHNVMLNYFVYVDLWFNANSTVN